MNVRWYERCQNSTTIVEYNGSVPNYFFLKVLEIDGEWLGMGA